MALIVLQRPTVRGAWVFPIVSSSSACRGTFGLFCGKQTHSSLLLTTREHLWRSWKRCLAGSLGYRQPGVPPLYCPPENAALSYRRGPLSYWLVLWRSLLRIPSVAELWDDERDTERKPISERIHT